MTCSQKYLLNFLWCTEFSTTVDAATLFINCVCVCLSTFDGTVPAQLSLRSPVTGAPHRGAGSSDGRLLLGIYGKWQLPLNKAEVAGEGKTTEVPNHKCTGLTLAENLFPLLCLAILLEMCYSYFWAWRGKGREKERKRGGKGGQRESPALNLLPLFGVMVYKVFLLAKITFLTWLTLDELFHISLTYLFKS